VRWGIERRLEYIEARLFWEGVVNRAHVSEAFGISSQQASADFARYMELAPDNTVYDRSRKGYVATEAFRPVVTKPDAGRYLAQLRLVGDGAVGEDDVDLPIPVFDVVPGPARKIDAGVLRSVLASIRSKLSVEVLYQSMSRPEPTWRWIAPHALAFDGFRWHARAWCDKDSAFKDFVLGRVREIRSSRPSGVDGEADRCWHERVRVIMGPHPGLGEGPRKAIEADYAMTGGVSVIDVRRCFLFYFLKRFGLDVDAKQRRPEDQHIVLLNDEDVLTALAGERTDA
jgi:hypothetical protein